MSSIVPPPPERFDPITARWLTPGGPLPDPQRDQIDPDRRDPVTIVGPVPPELNVLNDAHLREGAGLVGASTTHVLQLGADCPGPARDLVGLLLSLSARAASPPQQSQDISAASGRGRVHFATVRGRDVGR